MGIREKVYEGKGIVFTKIILIFSYIKAISINFKSFFTDYKKKKKFIHFCKNFLDTCTDYIFFTFSLLVIIKIY